MLFKRKKKYLRNVKEIGKRKYDFDISLEKDIYNYLSCYKMRRKVLDNLKDELRFDSYHKWRQYIREKYKDYDMDKLMEFSRYLNRELRGVKTGKAYWTMVIPVMLTLIITQISEWILELNFNVSEEPLNLAEDQVEFILIKIIAFVIVLAMGFGGYFLFLKKCLEPIFENDNEKWFLMDYKEVVDGIIEESKVK